MLAVATDEAAADAVAASLGDAGFALAADLTTADGVDALGASVPIVLGRLDGAVLRCTGGRNGGRRSPRSTTPNGVVHAPASSRLPRAPCASSRRSSRAAG